MLTVWAHHLSFRLYSFKSVYSPFYPSLRLDFLSRFAPSSWDQTSCVVKDVSESHQERHPPKPAVVRPGFVPVPVPGYPILLSWSLQDEDYIPVSLALLSLLLPFCLLPRASGYTSFPLSVLCANVWWYFKIFVTHSFFMALNLSFYNWSWPIAIWTSSRSNFLHLGEYTHQLIKGQSWNCVLWKKLIDFIFSSRIRHHYFKN